MQNKRMHILDWQLRDCGFCHCDIDKIRNHLVANLIVTYLAISAGVCPFESIMLGLPPLAIKSSNCKA